MSLKQKYFYYRDLIRFNWARQKFSYMPSGKAEDFAWSKMQHIVILKMDGKLGDTEVMTHFYRNLQGLPHHPKLSVVCPQNLQRIYQEILGFDRVVVCSRKPRQEEITSICQHLTSGGDSIPTKVDLVLSTEAMYRPRDFIFNYLLKPDYIAGCDPRVAQINLFIFDPRTSDTPIAATFAQLLMRGGVQPTPIAYEPLITAESSAHVRAALELPEHDLYIGINPCAATFKRRFKPEVVAALIHMILSAHPDSRALLLLRASEKEYINAIKEQLSSEEQALIGSRIRLLPEDSDVIGYCTHIDNLRGLITVDTAAVHLACASGIPLISFYNNDPMCMRRWAPVFACEEPLKYSSSKLMSCDDFSEIPDNDILQPAHDFITALIHDVLLPPDAAAAAAAAAAPAAATGGAAGDAAPESTASPTGAAGGVVPESAAGGAAPGAEAAKQ